MNREEVVQHLGALFKRLDDLDAAFWSGTTKDVERAQQSYELFTGLATTRQQLLGQLDANGTVLAYRVALDSPDGLPAAVAIALSAEGDLARVQLAVVVVAPDGDGPHWLCVRFESPEGFWYVDQEERGMPVGQLVGEHDYPHVQISNEMKDVELEVRAAPLPQWIPSSAIAAPVPGADPIELFLCALATIRHPRFVVATAAGCGEAVHDRLVKVLSATG